MNNLNFDVCEHLGTLVTINDSEFSLGIRGKPGVGTGGGQPVQDHECDRLQCFVLDYMHVGRTM